MVTNDGEHLFMHLLASGAPYLLECAFTHILSSALSCKTLDDEVNNI